jgi:hypothetical protein
MCVIPQATLSQVISLPQVSYLGFFLFCFVCGAELEIELRASQLLGKWSTT